MFKFNTIYSVAMGITLSLTTPHSSNANIFDDLGVDPGDIPEGGLALGPTYGPKFEVARVFPDGRVLLNTRFFDPDGTAQRKHDLEERKLGFLHSNFELVQKLGELFGAAVDREQDYMALASEGRVRDADLMFALFWLESEGDASVLRAVFEGIPTSERSACYDSLESELRCFRPKPSGFSCGASSSETAHRRLKSIEPDLLEVPEATTSKPLYEIIQHLRGPYSDLFDRAKAGPAPASAASAAVADKDLRDDNDS